ncbi:MAG: DUF1840 family protein [Aquabacterium sp.]|uniref:DUF1840 family protein n=1 Tax=Aquabacterium sp. TaxID=1872578 RepID=UPI001DC4B48F|nr:DUF1840 family protein [Aquabacterium sp.]MBT9609301.1 DUF1840 family protein [Aquabacterium sp.]
MPITFKSQATGDLVMLDKHAEALLQLLGKTAKAAGLLEPADMAHALTVLRAIEDPRDAQAAARAERAAEAPAGDEQEDEKEDEAPGLSLSFQDEPVSLRQRAAPFIRLIEQAQAEGKPIVWGV